MRPISLVRGVRGEACSLFSVQLAKKSWSFNLRGHYYWLSNGSGGDAGLRISYARFSTVRSVDLPVLEGSPLNRNGGIQTSRTPE